MHLLLRPPRPRPPPRPKALDVSLCKEGTEASSPWLHDKSTSAWPWPWILSFLFLTLNIQFCHSYFTNIPQRRTLLSVATSKVLLVQARIISCLDIHQRLLAGFLTHMVVLWLFFYRAARVPVWKCESKFVTPQHKTSHFSVHLRDLLSLQSK